jgi:hypothetical protein
MDELVPWLGEQLAEDERIARRAGDSFRQIGETGVIVAHDPARVLREIDAKRQLLTGYTKAVEQVEELDALRERLRASGQDVFMTEMERASAIHKRDVLHGVLQILALPYADRPGYREEWRP